MNRSTYGIVLLGLAVGALVACKSSAPVEKTEASPTASAPPPASTPSTPAPAASSAPAPPSSSGGSTAGVACGKTTCPAGQTCCNASCGICTPPGGSCTMQACGDGAGSASCTKDDECKAHSSYCPPSPCVCLAIAANAPPAACKNTVRCLVDPCAGKGSKCINNACVIVSK